MYAVKLSIFLFHICCKFGKALHVSRQGFYQYLANKDRPWKYQPLADAMMEIYQEDECNDTYGRIRMYQALILKQPEMLIFQVNARFIVVSAVFDCFDSSVIVLAMDTNRKAPLCVQTLENASKAYPDIRGAIIHSDRGRQYTSGIYRETICKYGIQQSMNSAGGRCHDNARCESMWDRMKSELLYDRYDTEKMTIEERKTLIRRYFISYWNNWRICSANGGLPPMVKRRQYYNSLKEAS